MRTFNKLGQYTMEKQITLSCQVILVHATILQDTFGITYQHTGCTCRQNMPNTLWNLAHILFIHWPLSSLPRFHTCISMMTAKVYSKITEHSSLDLSSWQTRKTDRFIASCIMMKSWCFILLWRCILLFQIDLYGQHGCSQSH